jgi:hypothetical protein
LALQGDSFTDGSLILRFVKQSQLDNCYEPILYLRLVKPDGIIQMLDLNGIPQDNFCRIVPTTGTPFQKNENHKNNEDNKYGGGINDSNNGVNNNRRDNNNNNNGNSGSLNNGENNTPGSTSEGSAPGKAKLAGTPRAISGNVAPAPAPAIPPTNILLDNIVIYALSKKYILITYYCNLPTSNELCGRIIDFNGVTKR